MLGYAISLTALKNVLFRLILTRI